MPAFEAWAAQANALVFTPEGAVRGPNGAVLVDPATGENEAGAFVPHLPDAVARKARTERLLQEAAVPFLKSLPPVASEAEVELRSVQEIAVRAMALLLYARRGDSLQAKQPIPLAQLQLNIPLGERGLSSKERDFVLAARPSEQALLESVWRYEALAVLAWSVGAVRDLPFPAGMCDVDSLTDTLFEVMKTFTPSPRSVAEILDALDLHYRLHWATRQARVNSSFAPVGVEPGVVAERHYALNWLTRFPDGIQGADWDDVDTPT